MSGRWKGGRQLHVQQSMTEDEEDEEGLGR